MKTATVQANNHRPSGLSFGRVSASALLMCLVALGGCGSTPYPSTPQATPTTPLINNGNADALVQQALQALPDDASLAWLQAAEALAADARPAEAVQALDKVNPDDLSDDTAFDYGALSAELALGRFDGPTARAFFAQLQPALPRQDARYQQLADAIQALNIDPAAAASALINAPAPRGNEAATQRNNQIWALISQTSAPAVSQLANTTNGIERSWWQLKEEMLSAFTVADATGRLTRWQTGNALHPASQTPPSDLAALQQNRQEFSHVALIVPQSGPLAAAGKAVRDGFFAAHLHASSVTTRSTGGRQLTVLDSASTPLPDLLQQAEALGADLIVGPLDKNRVAQLNLLPRRLPTLLLNYLPAGTSASGDLVQFGLAVEDEATAIARRIKAEGRERVVVLHNQKEWSLRARDALLAALDSGPQDPATLLDTTTTTQAVGIGSTPDVKQLTAVVGNTLLVDASQSRHRLLERVVGEDLEFVPRARKDVDAIVAFLDAPEARALRPALRFHFAAHVPVYTSSQALRRISERDLRDLRGFNISEIPWKLYPSPIKTAVESAFGVTQGGMVPLYALGVDAYRLADRLDLLLTQPHQRLLGGTGELSIEYGGRVRRDMAWQYVGKDGLTALPFVMAQ